MFRKRCDMIGLLAERSLYRELVKVVRACIEAYEKDQAANGWHGSTQDYMRPVYDAYKSFERDMKLYCRKDV